MAAGSMSSQKYTLPLALAVEEGYGSVSPRTTWGKLVTIIYALIGIPLMLLYLSATGDVLARSFRKLYGKMCGSSSRKLHCPCTNTVRVPVTLCLVIVLAYICSGALLFHRLENWSILEGACSYFCFTSLGTIGFGDLLPGQKAEEVSLCACSAYILTGMALVAMCFSLVQDEVLSLLRYLGATCAEPLVEYFVPRSISEFDLSLTSGDAPISTSFLPLTVRAPRKVLPKQKEKMVTFEDEMAARLSAATELQDVFIAQSDGESTSAKIAELAANKSGDYVKAGELSAAIGDLNTVKKELKQFKNFKICEDLKKCEEGCSCNAESDCDICKVIDFTLKKDKL
ncbi:hypothetical protein NQ315_002303 [Exocentrus adspersus]|uniref:Potassium channel domain-containing protein n=1 Tax=Exocentrus adspersus TaxID=1586481 RepID=A0AAV8VTN6_9CUCU|nr:hypothetical protein NQ315_002303 [Exocentrus adspersus]